MNSFKTLTSIVPVKLIAPLIKDVAITNYSEGLNDDTKDIIEKLKGSPVSPELQNKFSTVGLALLMLLMLVITVNDIIRLF